MYLFTRNARLATGNLAKSLDWALRVTEKVNSLTDVEVTLWSSAYSPGVGTLSWSAVIEDIAQMDALNAKSLADDSYMSLLDEGAQFSSGEATDDSLVQFVHLDPDAASGQPQYARVVSTVLTAGHSVEGMELGVEIAEKVKKITGRATSFGVGVTGIYGSVGWISLYDSIEEVQAAGNDLAADTSFAKMLDSKAAKAYQQGSGTQTLWRKMA